MKAQTRRLLPTIAQATVPGGCSRLRGRLTLAARTPFARPHAHRDRRRRRRSAPRDWQRAPHAGRRPHAPAPRDDRGGGEPHPRGDHRGRDWQRGGGGRVPYHRGARHHANRDGAWAGAGEPDAGA
eukprot:254792-Chlamydomonas_euryale.AAC.1